MKKILVFAVSIWMFNILYGVAIAKEQSGTFTLSQLATEITKLEKQKITLVGSVAGACRSGCKIWVSEGPYQKGNPVALVWAKDQAFKFKTDAIGREVRLTGYAIGKYVNLCALEKKEKTVEDQESKTAHNSKKDCDSLDGKQTNSRELQSITFFATSVDYMK